MLTRSLVLLVCQFRHFRISHFIGNFQCGRWDLNPHERNAHKILSLARLPVPTLPHDRISLGFFIFSLATSDSIAKWILYVNTFFQKFSIFSVFLLFCHDYLWSGALCLRSFLYALTLEAGTLNLQLERIPLNALAPVFAVVSFVPKIVTLESLLQP